MDPLTGRPTRVFFGYALPTIVGILAISSATIIDGLFVGNYVGSDALSWKGSLILHILPSNIGGLE